MLRIGKFASLSGLSVKALRFYDESGVLAPAFVDPDSGYRYYTAEQLPRVRQIVILRQLEVPLVEIRRALAIDGGFEERLRASREELQRRVSQARMQLAWIDDALSTRDAAVPVIARDTPSVLAASLRARIATYADCDGLMSDLQRRMPRTATVTSTGAVWHQCESDMGRLDCEVLLHLDGEVDRRGALRITQVPARHVASALYRGNDWSGAYAAIARWMRSNDFEPTGPKQEQFLTPELTEVQIPFGGR